MLSPFRLQYAFALAALASVFLLWRIWKSAVVFGLLALLNLAVILPAVLSKDPLPAPAGPAWRAVLLNVRTENRRHDLVKAFLAETNPDFIVLEEVDSPWIAALAELQRTHPHSIVAARDDNFGIALFSRWPIQRGETLYLGGAEIPSHIARCDSQGRTLTVLATHPLPPGGPEYSRGRNAQLAAIPAGLAAERGAILLLGDLNATPWCHPFRKLVAASGLKLPGVGSGLHLSWPVEILPLRIPIDHCLINSNLAVTAEHLGPNVGSDHFPLVVDFKLRP